jgi:hypothetical protein
MAAKPRSSVDTANWRRLVDLCSSNPGGVTIARGGGFGRYGWTVYVHRPDGVETGTALEIADALHCIADNLDRAAA